MVAESVITPVRISVAPAMVESTAFTNPGRPALLAVVTAKTSFVMSGVIATPVKYSSLVPPT